MVNSSRIFTAVSFDWLSKPTNLDAVRTSRQLALMHLTHLLIHLVQLHLIRVKALPTHLHNYHCNFSIATLESTQTSLLM
jgi:hypothetical protein